MLAKLGDRFTIFFRATAPDPFVLAVLLTAATVIACLTLGQSPGNPDARPTISEVIHSWTSPVDTTGDGNANTKGLWGFLAFSMQMCLILVTGHALAASKPVSFIIHKLASLPRTGAQGAALVGFTAASLGILNWGLGLVGGALIARDVARAMRARGIPVHYPLLAAAGYLGLLVWHGGLSGTAPTKVTTREQLQDILPPELAAHIEPISLTQTIFSPLNIVVTGGLLIIAPLVMALMSPKGTDSAHNMVDIPSLDEPNAQTPPPSPPSTSHRKSRFLRTLEDTPIINLILISMIAWWAFGYYIPSGDKPSGITALTPNTINLTMLMLGLLLHSSPMSYVRAVEAAARSCAGIILQFPLYAGIMGMMHATGLTSALAGSIASIANTTTLPIFTFFSAAFVNLFVPSGGGQWGVQGPIAVQTALETGVPVPTMVMAVAYGDQLTNMLQPFWALPLLAITGVKARDIVGYTAVVMLVAALWIITCLLIIG